MSEEAFPTRVDGDEATVVISGEIDLAVAPGLREHLDALHERGVRSVALEASGVSFIDSVGLSILVATDRRCRDQNGRFSVISPSPVMRRTMEIAGLMNTIDVVD